MTSVRFSRGMQTESKSVRGMFCSPGCVLTFIPHRGGGGALRDGASSLVRSRTTIPSELSLRSRSLIDPKSVCPLHPPPKCSSMVDRSARFVRCRHGSSMQPHRAPPMARVRGTETLCAGVSLRHWDCQVVVRASHPRPSVLVGGQEVMLLERMRVETFGHRDVRLGATILRDLGRSAGVGHSRSSHWLAYHGNRERGCRAAAPAINKRWDLRGWPGGWIPHALSGGARSWPSARTTCHGLGLVAHTASGIRPRCVRSSVSQEGRGPGRRKLDTSHSRTRDGKIIKLIKLTYPSVGAGVGLGRNCRGAVAGGRGEEDGQKRAVRSSCRLGGVSPATGVFGPALVRRISLGRATPPSDD